jgi:AAA domain
MIETRSSWTAQDLMRHEFPEARYAVPGLVAEGLNLLVGSPKLGKSWFAMNVAAAVAYGGIALDRVRVERGEALYLALEDPPRRLQRRLSLLLAGEPAPSGLYFETAWPVLLDGGCDQLDVWLRGHQACRLVVVDVFAKVRGIPNGNVSRYEADYAAMASLKLLADRHNVAVLVVHHTRKAAAEDYVDSVSGTHGLAGAADAVLVLTRSRGSADAKLHITGRDVEEAEHAMKFDAAAGSWGLLEGPAQDYDLSETRRRILAYVREHGSATPKVLAAALSLEHDAARQACSRMARDGQLATDGTGAYYDPSQPSHLSLIEGGV